MKYFEIIIGDFDGENIHSLYRTATSVDRDYLESIGEDMLEQKLANSYIIASTDNKVKVNPMNREIKYWLNRKTDLFILD